MPLDMQNLDLDREIELEACNNFETYSYNEPGSLPGTLLIDKDAATPNIFLIDYNAEKAIGTQLATPEECLPYLDSESVSWVDVQGLGSEDVLQRLGKVFHLHPIMMEDIVNVPQRPKVEDYGDRVLIVLWMLNPRKKKKHGFVTEQVSLIIGKNYVLTVQEEPEQDCFEPVRQRIHKNRGIIREMGTDYLAYALIDAVIDGFFPILENYGERLELMQDRVIGKPRPEILTKIQRIKRELLLLRRAIWPQRDAINALVRDDSALVGHAVRVYLRDCYDHTVQIVDMVETYRELAANLMEIYLSSISNRTNEVMRFLTVISTIFIPLTFIAGVYGMNFDRSVVGNMPELGMPYGYVFCLLFMLGVSGALLSFFWRRGWLFDPTRKS